MTTRRRFLGTLAALGVAASIKPTALAAAKPLTIPYGTILLMADGDNSAVHAIYSEHGLIPCDGRFLSRSHYRELFAAVGAFYGSGPGMFALPDLRGRIT
jgi:hypothetical protein